MTEILLLGTFHFRESHFDIYSPDTQNEIKRIVDNIAGFMPEAIGVEFASRQQAEIDGSYRRLNLNDFDNPKKISEETLGSISMFDQTASILYKNECVQIGYRLGKRLGLKKIYGVDEDMEMDGALFENPSERVRTAIEVLNQYEMSNNFTGQLRGLNSEEWSRRNQNVYMTVNAENSDNQYNGSMTITKWYERNLKIFSNIQRLSAERERVFVLYGAGHLQLLRNFINETEGLKLVDVGKFI